MINCRINILKYIDNIVLVIEKPAKLVFKIKWICAFINYTKIYCFIVKMYWMKSIYVLFLRVIENEWKFFLNEQMTRISDN